MDNEEYKRKQLILAKGNTEATEGYTNIIPYIQGINSTDSLVNANDLINPEYNGYIVKIDHPNSSIYDLTFDLLDDNDPVANAVNRAKDDLLEKARESLIIKTFIANKNPTKKDRINYERELSELMADIYQNIDIKDQGKIFAQYRAASTSDYNLSNVRGDGKYLADIKTEEDYDFSGPPEYFKVENTNHLNDVNKTSTMCCGEWMSVVQAILLQHTENNLLPTPKEYEESKNNYKYATSYYVVGRNSMVLDNEGNVLSAGRHAFIMSEATSSVFEATDTEDKKEVYRIVIDPNYNFHDMVAGKNLFVKSKDNKIFSYGNEFTSQDLIAKRKREYRMAKATYQGFNCLNHLTIAPDEWLINKTNNQTPDKTIKAELAEAVHLQNAENKGKGHTSIS